MMVCDAAMPVRALVQSKHLLLALFTSVLLAFPFPDSGLIVCALVRILLVANDRMAAGMYSNVNRNR